MARLKWFNQFLCYAAYEHNVSNDRINIQRLLLVKTILTMTEEVFDTEPYT